MDVSQYGYACDDCTVAIANDDYSGMSNEQAKRTREGLERINEHLVIGEPAGFMWRACDVCGNPAGERHEFFSLTPPINDNAE